MRARLTVLLAVLSVVGVASAQEVQPVPRGARVRVTAATQTPVVVGQLIAVNDSTLVIRRHRRGEEVTIPRSDVLRLEVSRGTSRTRSTGMGALLGLGIGGLVGFAGGEDSCGADAWFCLTRPWAAAVGGTAGVAIGSVLGLVVGSFERWRDTAVPMSLSVVPTGGGSLSIVSRIAF